MTATRVARAVFTAWLLTVSTALGQSGDDLAVMLHEAREGTARFTDRMVAIASGYRRIGPDFPGMGEHWVNVRLLMSSLDAARPAILSYVNIEGRPTLVGVAYAQAVSADQSAPRWLAEDNMWHFHQGTIRDESFGRSQHDMEQARGVRLAVLHAWIWMQNPAGVFARDNWVLPYVRAGLAPPADPSVGASRALSLVSGNVTFWREHFLHTTAASPEEVDAALQTSGDAVRAVLAREQSSIDRDRALTQVWRMLCTQMGVPWDDESQRGHLRPVHP